MVQVGAYPFDLTGAARLLVDEADAEDAVAVLSQRTANRKARRRPAEPGS